MPNPHVEPSALVVSGIMAATFGGFHLAYAAAGLGVWRRAGGVGFITYPALRMFDFDRLDKLIHEKGRLAIMTLLAARPNWPFQDLKAEVKMSDGNLISHLRTLHQAGYVGLPKGNFDPSPDPVRTDHARAQGFPKLSANFGGHWCGAPNRCKKLFHFGDKLCNTK